jgi:hypothetical protein
VWSWTGLNGPANQFKQSERKSAEKNQEASSGFRSGDGLRGDRGDGLARLILKIVIHAKSRLERTWIRRRVSRGGHRHCGVGIGKGDQRGVGSLLGNRLRILGPS